MVDDLKPYPAYKPSGVEWLTKLPRQWQVRRAKYLFRPIDIRSTSGDEELLTVSSSDGVVPRREKSVTMFMAESYVGAKLCWPGDLVINSLWAWARGLGFSRYHGIVSAAYGVYRPRNGFSDYWRYFDKLLRSEAYQWEFQVRSKGVWISRLQLTDTAFLEMLVPLPPPDEQAAIVRFLDHIDARIRRYIQAKRRLIALLTEQKQALIHQAVTQGLDSSAPRKPSGVAWLGNIPAHWEVMKLRRLVSFNPSKSEINGLQDDASTVVFLPMEKVSEDGEIDCSEQRPVQQVRSGFPYFRRHDVIIAKITPCFENGKGAYLGSLVSEYGYGSTEFIVLRAGPRIDPQYAYLVSKSPLFRHLGKEAMTGAAGQQRVPLDFVKEFPVPLPPLSEQAGILKAVDDEQARIQLLINTARREIGLIREYRTRLIADVVTGQVNVRGVALPEIAELVPNAAEAWEEGESGEETSDEDDPTEQEDDA